MDTRDPAVYVYIEDASYMAPTIQTGRKSFGVTLCEKGPHNTLVDITGGPTEFHRIFGQPNYKRTHQVHYQLDQAARYGPILVCRVVPEGSTMANVMIKEKGQEEKVEHVYFFKENSKVVESKNKEGVEAVVVGQWIYAEHDSKSVAQQVIAKEIDESDNKYEIKIAEPYEGTTTRDNPQFGEDGANLYRYIGYTTDTNESLEKTADVNDVDPELIYTIYATGAGDYYNRLFLKGNRNTEFEKMYTDDHGEPKYPFLFMDIALYELTDEDSYRRLEGPWTVSLTSRTPDGQLIRDINTGEFMYIENVINERSNQIKCVSSDGVNKLSDSSDAHLRRMQVMSMFSFENMVATDIVGMGTGVNLENGKIGEGQYNNQGNLMPSDDVYGLVSQAYEGVLESADDDNSIQQLREYIYPFVQPDYILSGGYPSFVQTSARALAALRMDCVHLGDTGFRRNPEDDLDARREEYPWNDWTSALYVQWRQVFDAYTGSSVWMSPIYHAIDRHLFCDDRYFIAEPVANIEKGAVADQMKLAYNANHTRRGDLLDAQLNYTLKEPDGQYFITQTTTWKRLSVLQQLHVAKFVAFVRKRIPPLLKDILQRKATPYWIEQARFRVWHFLNDFTADNANERYQALNAFNVGVEFDDNRSELNVYVDLTPIRAIQRIHVFITVH